jgi:lipopolysaccharide/colanic/teichoic acid biosynthesis glycosyltransferase
MDMKIESINVGIPKELSDLLKIPAELSFFDRYIKLLFAISAAIMGLLIICLLSCCCLKCGRRKGEGWRWYQSERYGRGKSFYHQVRSPYQNSSTNFKINVQCYLYQGPKCCSHQTDFIQHSKFSSKAS